MKKSFLVASLSLFSLLSCSPVQSEVSQDNIQESGQEAVIIPSLNDDYYRGFSIDNVLYSDKFGAIHYNVYVPDSYDGSFQYAIYFTLPGYQGLYRFGPGVNLETENFAFEAMTYIDDMIIVAPQLNDWGETSARETIELVHYCLENYNIDRGRVYANGYSGGGETMSLVMGIEPELFTRYLHCSSRWDGDLNTLVDSRVPVYLVIGENDEYYGSESTIETYNTIVQLYEEDGLDNNTISSLVTLDVKEHDYFTSQGINNEHGGGGQLFSRDETIMGWLFQE